MLRASIVIKSNDQRLFLEQSFPLIAEQTERSYEIIFLYSGSDESTVSLAKRWNAHIIRVRPEEFSHSKALNQAAKEAKGEFLVVLSADAVPATNQWLSFLLRHFDNPKVAGVYGRHVPRTRFIWNPVYLIELARLRAKYPSKSRVLCLSDTHSFSNANSAIRRSLWGEHNFDERLFEVEDYEWSGWAQRAGYCIVYDADAAVKHTHWEQYGLVAFLARAVAYKRLRKEIDEGLAGQHNG
jgi:rhamnosyltransferase